MTSRIFVLILLVSCLGKHWAARGYVVVHLQHAGSDESVWKDLPRDEAFAV